MATCTVHPKGALSGEVHIPPSKSHTMRALLFASMGKGESRLQTPLRSPDTLAMVRACRQLGAEISEQEGEWIVRGVGGAPQVPGDIIDAGNSGQVLRFIGAVSALAPGWTVVTGDESVRTRRPAAALLDGLCQLGATAYSTRSTGFAPIVVGGPMRAGRARIDGSDSQPLSALLIAASFLEGESEISAYNAKEQAWVDLTLSWLLSLGIEAERVAPDHYRVVGPAQYEGFSTTLPGDYSSAAFPAAAALVTNGSVRLKGLHPDDVQGDRLLFDLFAEMGAEVGEEVRAGQLHGIEVDLNRCIDALPILAVVGCFASGEMRLRNGRIARQKESDRIASIATQLRAMGADLDELDDGLTIRQSQLRGCSLSACNDHRIAMALIVAALGAEGESRISGAEWIEKSYPHFVQEMNRLGAKIE